ncbi:hypothetical protein B0H14DRAFT_2818024, partial [Mycena olivaceomarginata]
NPSRVLSISLATLILIIFASPVTFALTLLIYPSSLAPPGSLLYHIGIERSHPKVFYTSPSRAFSDLRVQNLGRTRCKV